MKRIFTPADTPCTRCWHCCIEPYGGRNKTLEAGLALQWQQLFKDFTMCPVLGVADDALPICLIHFDGKPEVCKKYHCLLIKSAPFPTLVRCRS